MWCVHIMQTWNARTPIITCSHTSWWWITVWSCGSNSLFCLCFRPSDPSQTADSQGKASFDSLKMQKSTFFPPSCLCLPPPPLWNDTAVPPTQCFHPPHLTLHLPPEGPPASNISLHPRLSFPLFSWKRWHKSQLPMWQPSSRPPVISFGSQFPPQSLASGSYLTLW